MARRIYIIAGEASGDLHGGNLVREILALAAESGHPPPVVRSWGGDRMAQAGAEVVKHIRELAFMGFTQVLLNLPTILRNIKTCKADIEAFLPDALVLIDYPGFNMRIAEWAHARGIPVHWYISPQVWAWKAGRVRTLERVVDRMYVILPFEKEWFAQRGMEVEFVGHPLLDAIQQEAAAPPVPLPGPDQRPLVALLPGSRRQEITRMLPLMAKAAQAFPDHRFVVAAAPSVPDALYDEVLGASGLEVVRGVTYDVLRQARAALVTSGTATLETALFGVPQVVCYKGGTLNVWLARRLVNVPFISLVNLVMGREVVRELVQDDLSEAALVAELGELLREGPKRHQQMADLVLLKGMLGGPGASRKVAFAVWKSLGTAT